jgi:protein-tyrosine-phosphatase
MAEVFFNKLAKGKAKAISAGTKPFNGVMIMREIEIGIDWQKPKSLTADRIKDADKILTIGCDADMYSTFSVEPKDWQIEELGLE